MMNGDIVGNSSPFPVYLIKNNAIEDSDDECHFPNSQGDLLYDSFSNTNSVLMEERVKREQNQILGDDFVLENVIPSDISEIDCKDIKRELESSEDHLFISNSKEETFPDNLDLVTEVKDEIDCCMVDGKSRTYLHSAIEFSTATNGIMERDHSCQKTSSILALDPDISIIIPKVTDSFKLCESSYSKDVNTLTQEIEQPTGITVTAGVPQIDKVGDNSNDGMDVKNVNNLSSYKCHLTVPTSLKHHRKRSLVLRLKKVTTLENDDCSIRHNHIMGPSSSKCCNSSHDNDNMSSGEEGQNLSISDTRDEGFLRNLKQEMHSFEIALKSISYIDSDSLKHDNILHNNSIENKKMQTRNGHKVCRRKSDHDQDISFQGNLRENTEQKPFICEADDENFTDTDTEISNLHEFMGQHKGENPFRCDECGKTCRNKNGLRIHMRRHVEEKPFICEGYDESFTDTSDTNTEVSNLHEHIGLHKGGKTFKCDECGKTYRYSNGLRRHMSTHTGENSLKCDECGESFSHCSKLDTHKRTHRKLKPLQCDDCGKIFTRNSKLIVHIRKHTGERPFQCTECGRSFSDASNLNTHKKTHTREKPFQCDECGESFSHSRKLDIHMRTHTGEKRFQCAECGRSFKDNHRLKEHMRKHSPERPFHCDECGKSFTYRANLNAHMKIHNVNLHICHECGRGFTYGSNLHTHMRTHTGEKPFICDECGKAFSQSSSLHTHMKTHTRGNPFKCVECGKTLSSKQGLHKHMRTHTGEKPFHCDVCGKDFSQRNSLLTHMRTHTKESPFKCVDCGKSFGTNQGLHKHMRTHTGEKPFRCDDCGKSFSQSSTLHTHMRKHTSENPFEFKCVELKLESLVES